MALMQIIFALVIVLGVVKGARAQKVKITANSVVRDKEIEVLLRDDAKTLGLAQPVAPAKVFDFTLQREVNRELGIK